MGTLDIIILACLLPAFYFGIKNGLVKQLISFCVIFFGVKLSLQFSEPVAQWAIAHLGVQEFAGKVISFIVIFLVVAIVFSLIGKIIERIIKISLLGWLNKLLGIVVALAIFATILSVLAYLFNSLNTNMHLVEEAKIAESRFYPYLLDLANHIFPHIKEIIG